MSSLYIDRRGVEVRLDGEALAFYEKGARAGTIPLAPLERVFLRGDVILHANLLGKLGEKGIGVVVLSGRKAEPSLLMATPHNDASRRIAQFRMSQNPEFCLKISKQLMEKKLKGQIALLETILDGNFRHRFLVGHRQRFMKESLEKMAACADLASLRGLEGVATREYFQALAEVLPKSLGFHGRNRRPPKDPFNAVLSLGYTLLQAEASIALYGAGLDPYVGFYHALEYGRESLSCDVVEALRPEVDRFSIQCFREQTLRPEDFSTPDDGSCLLGKAGRERFYPAWEAFAEEFRRQLTGAANDLADMLQKSAARPS